MITKLITAFQKRRIDRELMQLELEELQAHAQAEFNVIKAERALTDAELRRERAHDDARMHKRWETKRLEIERKYLALEQPKEDFGIFNGDKVTTLIKKDQP